jgi:hypothetical protein
MDNEKDTEGLTHLRWSMFDSPDSEGSGYLFMEREPVYILDVVCKMYRIKPDIILGYTSKPVSDKMFLSSKDAHRVGLGVRIRILSTRKRMILIKGLVECGIQRIAVSKDVLYFDTDSLKPAYFAIW